MFKKYDKGQEVLIKRFREFDEARKYIEDPSSYDEETVLSAVDYMITHKEYYFLLKNLYRQIQEKKINRKLLEYAFMNLGSVCPKRKEEKEIYLNILKTGIPDYTQPLEQFLKSCCVHLKEFVLSLIDSSQAHIRKTAVQVLMHCPDRKVKQKIKKHLAGESEPEVAETVVEYLKIYGEKEDVEFLRKLQERFPQLKEKIEESVKGI
ncbi:HEAT repeat domain-containing protein [Persephonella sp.]